MNYCSIEDIAVLNILDTEGERSFIASAKEEAGVLTVFPGPGPLYIVGKHAYFTLFVINPKVS